jgi:SAM-dependent methyltransferase
MPCPICNSEGDYTIIYRRNFSRADLNTDIFSARRLPDCIHYQVVKCNNDGLLRSNPVLNEHSLVLLYKKSKFTYNEEVVTLTASYLSALKEVLARLPKTAKILEIGCGSGFVLKALSEMGYKNVFGIEPSSDAVGNADKSVKDKIITDIFRAGIFQPQTFDFIFFFQTFDHIQDPNGFLNLCYQLLLPGGYILAFNHDADSLAVKIFGEKSPVIDIEHTCFYSKKTIKKIFEKNNFQPIKIYSPKNLVSFKYLFWLLPLVKPLKVGVLNSKSRIFQALFMKKIKIKLGNLCVIAMKAAG